MLKANCILLVDDNQTSTFLHQQLINKLDIAHQVLLARNGQQGLEVMEQHFQTEAVYPELILLDIKMPVMDGFAFFEAFQQMNLDKQSAPQVVVLTTSLAAVDIERAREIGIQYFVNKPLTAQKLQDVWPKHIRKTVPEQ